MKLFYYDTKHQQVIDDVDLGKLNKHDISLINVIIKFLQDTGLTDGRYKNLALADEAEITYIDGEPHLILRDKK